MMNHRDRAAGDAAGFPFPVPQYRVKSIYTLTPGLLTSLGIKLLLLDLDNTLAAYGGGSPAPRLIAWARELRNGGIEPFILSNNRRGHAKRFAREFGSGCVDHAGKPSPRAVFRLLGEKGVAPKNCALAGDQVYTDILCARRAGVVPILVEPIELSNIFRRIRRGLERPFRARCKKFLEDYPFDES